MDATFAKVEMFDKSLSPSSHYHYCSTMILKMKVFLSLFSQIAHNKATIRPSTPSVIEMCNATGTQICVATYCRSTLTKLLNNMLHVVVSHVRLIPQSFFIVEQ